MVGLSFKTQVYELVAQIPKGRLMTYGDVAVLAGRPYAARQVGGLAHFGPPDLPWQRVVNRQGGLASGYYGGKAGHQAALEAEGVTIEDFKVVNFEELRWRPSL
jgi:methylated-DNA-protein-cysteine methyltransferase-like protein